MKKGSYVDGFVLTIPKKNTKAYVKMAQEASRVWKKFGALEYYECMGEDLKPKPGPDGIAPRSFIKTAEASGSDTVWFSFIVYKNRAHRDAVNKKVMAYFSKKYAGKEDTAMPFDMQKMSYGGFRAMVKS